MKRKILLILLVGVLLIGLTGCDKKAEQTQSNYEIKGAYLGEIYAKDGYNDLYLVIDYSSNGKNIERLNDNSKISLTMGENNYTINTNDELTSSRESEQTYSIYSYFERATGYYYILGEGNILGNSIPTRMFAHFNINPNDIENNEEIKLTIGTETITYQSSKTVKIKTQDEILRVEDDFETKQILSSFIWRIDYAYEQSNFVKETSGMYGSAFKSLSNSLLYTFDENVNWGISVSERRNYCPSTGLSKINDIYYSEALNTDMPSFKLDKVINNYPESETLIREYIDSVNKFAECLVKSTTTDSKASELLKNVNSKYKELCESLGIEPLQYY